MTKSVDADHVPKRYVIHEEGGERFIYAQPEGEKINLHEKPSIAKITVVALLTAAALALGFVEWLSHLDLSKR
jgi:hypothetical protein